MKEFKKILVNKGQKIKHSVELRIPISNLEIEYQGTETPLFRIDNKTKEIIPFESPHGLIIFPAKEFNDLFKVNKNYVINGTIVKYTGFGKGILFADEYDLLSKKSSQRIN